MHVLLDATAVQPPLTGVQRAVRNEVLAILRSPHRPDGLLLTTDDVLLHAAREADFPCLAPEIGRSRLRRILWQQLRLPELIRRQTPDALHAFAYTAPRRCTVPLFLNVHDLIPFERPDLCGLRNRLHMRWLMPPAIRRAARLIVSSTPVAESLATRFGVPRDRITVAPLGVDAGRFASPAPRPARAPGEPYLLFVGNLEPKKGVEILLDAWQAVRNDTGLKLVICGRAAWKSGDLQRELHDLKPDPDFLWYRDVGDAELPGLYQHAWATVLPSRIEGFGLPVLESMAAGTPVIHSDHPVLMETAGGCGFPFRSGDNKSLADVIRQLDTLPQTERDAVVQNGRRRAETRTWDAWAATVYPH